MAKKITELTEATTVLDTDVLPIVNNNVTKKVKKENLLKEVNERIDDAEGATDAVVADLAAHEADVANPHEVTKAQVGLGNVDNTADVNKPVSTPVAQEFLKNKSPHQRRQAYPNETMLTMLAAGHGYTKQGADGTVDLNDTTDFALGTQSIKITTDGDGNAVTVRGPSIGAISMVDKSFRIWVKFEDLANLNAFALFAFSNNGTVDSFRWTFAHGTDLFPLNQQGEWVAITLSWADATIAGSPLRDNITRFQFQATDTGAGAAIVHVNGISSFDDGASLYPNGVISINFDDNWDTQYTNARPILEAAGLRANFNVIADRLGESGYMTMAQLESLHDVGLHEVNCHAYTLVNHNLNYVALLAAQGADALEVELGNIKNWLIDNGFADGADLMVLPNGAYSPAVKDIYKRFFSYVRTIYAHQGQYVETLPPSDPHAIRAISGISGFSGGISVAEVQAYITKIQANKGWGILTFHRIVASPTSTNECSIADFQTIITAILASGVAVRTIGDVMRSMDTTQSSKSYAEKVATESSVSEIGNNRAKRQVLTNFQASHGFVKQSAAGTQSDDTTDFVTGTQSLKLLTGGDGQAVFTRKASISPTIDARGKFIEVMVKVSDTSKVSELYVYLSSDNFVGSNFYTFRISDDISQIKSGVWFPVTISFGSAGVTGSPDRSAINAIQVRVKDDATGAVSVNYGGLNLVPEPVEGIVTVQFDDNWDSVYSKAMPILTALGLPAVIFTIAARVNSIGYMTEEQLRECQDVLGWDIANHSFDHINFTTLTPAQAENDMIKSRNWLRKRGFKAADHWAWPNGAYDMSVLMPLIKKYARSARTIAAFRETLAPGDNYRLRVRLVLDTTPVETITADIDRAKLNKEWLILVYHKIVDTLTGGVTTEHLTADFATEMAYIASSGLRCARVTDVLDRGNGQDIPWKNEGYFVQRKNNPVVPNRRVVTGSVTMDDSDDVIIATSGTFSQAYPNPASVAPLRELAYYNNGSGTITLTTPSGTIGGAASLTLLPGDSVKLMSDLTNWILK